MPKQLPVVETAKRAWLDVKNALPAMPIVTIAAFVVILLEQLAGFLALPDLTIDSPTLPGLSTMWLQQIVLDLVLTTVMNFFLVPFYIAIHRYIILGETTTRYSLNPAQPRFQLFFAWSMAPQILMAITSATVITSIFSGSLIALFILLNLTVVVLSIRIVPLFPAIAVDSPNATWRNALNDTADNFWRIVGTAIVVAVPLLLISAIVTFGLGLQTIWIMPFISTFVTALTIATASRIYLAIGDQLTPGGVAA